MQLIRYVMKIVYANENYAKYGVPGLNYFMALMMATIYIVMTGFMVLSCFLAIFPNFYKSYVVFIQKIPSIPVSVVLIVIIFFLLRIGIKEDSLKDTNFTKEYVNKSVNYLIAYGLATGFIIIFLGLKFLRYYRHDH